MPPDTVLLLRHGEVEDRFAKCCRGVTDVALSEVGERQSEANARLLVRRGVGAVVTTGLARTDRVGSLASASGVLHVVDRRLQERDFGEWEGQPWTEIAAQYPDLKRKMDAYEDFLPPGGESASALLQRVSAAWMSILARPETQVAVVGHGFVNVTLLCHIQGRPYGRVRQEKGGVSLIRVRAGAVVSVSGNMLVTADLRLIPAESHDE